MRIRAIAMVTVVFMLAALAPDARAEICGDRSPQGAMWSSILRPGVGEWYLRGFGAFQKAPQRKSAKFSRYHRWCEVAPGTRFAAVKNAQAKLA